MPYDRSSEERRDALDTPETRALVDQWHRANLESIQQVVDANQDLNARVRELGIAIELGGEDDTVFIQIGPSQEAVTVAMDSWLMFRVDIDTRKVVSIEVEGLSDYLHRHPKFMSFVGDLIRDAFPKVKFTPANVGLNELVYA